MSEDDRIARQMDKAGMDMGIYRKFLVSRTDGSSRVGGKHEHCSYFVLRMRSIDTESMVSRWSCRPT